MTKETLNRLMRRLEDYDVVRLERDVVAMKRDLASLRREVESARPHNVIAMGKKDGK